MFIINLSLDPGLGTEYTKKIPDPFLQIRIRNKKQHEVNQCPVHNTVNDCEEG